MPTTSTNETLTLQRTTKRTGFCSSNGTTTTIVSNQDVSDSRTVPDSTGGRNWRKRIRRHECVWTSLVGERNRVTYSPSFLEVVARDNQCIPEKIGTETHDGFIHVVPTGTRVPTVPSTLSLTTAENRAISAYVSSVNRARTSLESMVALGEAGQTVKLISRQGKRLARNVENHMYGVKVPLRRILRKRKPRKLRIAEASDFVSSRWLEASFGWRPLINDLDGAAQALARIATETNNWVQPVKGEGDLDSHNIWTHEYTAGHYRVKWEWEKISRRQVIFRGKMKISPANKMVMTRLGFSFEGLVPTIWELVPFSFLVDYFTNVGNVIEGWAFNRTGLLWTLKTTRRLSTTQQRNLRYFESTPPSDKRLSTFLSPGTYSWERSLVDRSRYYGDFVPTMSFQIPTGGTKWANMAALAVQLLPWSRTVNRLLVK